jgi:hypothetical protein
MNAMTVWENIIVWSIVILWNGYLIYKMRKEDKNGK